MCFRTIALFVVVITVVVAHGHGGYGHGGDGGYGDGHAHYKFEYGVHDPHTHDIKSQHEHRDGHHLTGGYSLKEADGTHRIVKYRSDPHTGFEAIVERLGHAHHPGKHGHGHGGTSWVGVTHWHNQGHGHGHGY